MKLSIVIVNYNVEYFLEQCLQSVYGALKNIEGEVWVVDNHSVDNSVQMVKRKFNRAHLIENQENVGFAKANNQAIRQAVGQYVLLLNPDTVVEEDTFEKCISFMDSHPEAGALGVKMINGKGEFLPESKRSLPLPHVAFYKIFGLSKLFPHSKKFASYHLSYLDKDEINEVEVLSGAYMFIRKSVLERIGLLDEDYFMYGEDIDLSYRIMKAGYKNYYFPATRIIHYKGESTKKSSINYVFVFYRAMQIFAQKHFSQTNAKLFNWMINIAIWFRASLAIIKRFFIALLLPFIDFFTIYIGMFFLARYWENAVLSLRDSTFPSFYYYLVIPLYIILWLFAVACCKGYVKPIQLNKTNKGIALGTVVILLIYALLPESFRFSRAVILFGAMWTVIALNSLRYIMNKLHIQPYLFGGKEHTRIAIVGNNEEADRVATLFRLVNKKYKEIAIITVADTPSETNNKYNTLGSVAQIKDIISIYKISEIIFCSKDIPAERIIDLMTVLQDYQVDFKIAPQESSTIIGSNSIKSIDDLYTIQLNAIGKKENKRKKRILDITTSFIFLLFSPFIMLFMKDKKKLYKNMWQILTGKLSFVGLQPCANLHELSNLKLKQGVLFPTDGLELSEVNEDIIYKADIAYTRDYQIGMDLQIIFKGFKKLG